MFFFCEVSESDEEEGNKDNEDKSCFTAMESQSKNFRNYDMKIALW